MYCTNCGQHVADNAKFCWHCGERITQHNLTTTPEAIDDLVTNKAEEIMVQEDNISFSDLGTNDYVAQKASFMAEISNLPLRHKVHFLFLYPHNSSKKTIQFSCPSEMR